VDTVKAKNGANPTIGKRPEISVIVPVFNESGNIEIFYHELKTVMERLDRSYEILVIDDGSTDETWPALEKISKDDVSVKSIRFRYNCGQTSAISAGFEFAQGHIFIPMDGDLQNDPADIPRFIGKLEEGYEVVSGWRRERKDKFITRRIPSIAANWIISKISGVKLHDYGCTMKAYRRDVIEGVHLYGEMHRFIPVYTYWQGAKVTEMIVNHRPRKFGATNYNLNRIFKVILDLIVIKFLESFSRNPIYLYGGFGLISILLSIIAFALMIYFKFWGGKTFIQTPLPMLTVMFGLIGVVSVLIGLMAEMGTRTYYESQQKKTYQIKEKINI